MKQNKFCISLVFSFFLIMLSPLQAMAFLPYRTIMSGIEQADSAGINRTKSSASLEKKGKDKDKGTKKKKEQLSKEERKRRNTIHQLAIKNPDRYSFLEDWADGMTGEDYEYSDEVADELQDILSNTISDAQHRMDINNMTRRAWESLSFLTSSQIDELCEYQERYGIIRSLGELSLLYTLGEEERTQLRDIFFADTLHTAHASSPWWKRTKFGKHDLSLYSSIPTYQRRGIRENKYEGDGLKHWLRYTYNIGNDFKIAFAASKDAGESFFSGHNKSGFDFYTGFLQMKNTGIIKNLVIGRYKLRAGSGLVINTSMNFGKRISMLQIGTNAPAISGHSSRMESTYLQGAAVTLKLPFRIELTPFVSYRTIDATLNKDSTIATILTSGYHRTESEINREKNAKEWAGGALASIRFGAFHFGATGIFYGMNRDIKPKTEAIYRKYYLSGNNFWNASVNYGYEKGVWNISGETATGSSGGMASINSINYTGISSLSITALYRYYGYRYASLFSNALSEGGNVQNESGFMLSADWAASHRLTLSAYTDFAYMPWAKYGATVASSRAWDNLLQGVYSKGKWSLSLRYRMKMREKDNEKKNALIWKTEHRLRAVVQYNSKHFTLSTLGGLSNVSYKQNSVGWLIGETARLSLLKRARIDASLLYFKTDDYDSRLSFVETSLPHTLSTAVCYGHGIHYTLISSCDITKNISAFIRGSATKYFDRSQISSSYQTIYSSTKTDIELMMRLRF